MILYLTLLKFLLLDGANLSFAVAVCNTLGQRAIKHTSEYARGVTKLILIYDTNLYTSKIAIHKGLDNVHFILCNIKINAMINGVTVNYKVLNICTILISIL